LGWWQDDPRSVGARDVKAGGTWLGVARSGRFGVVTNYRDLQAPVEGAPSRGHLVPRFLTGATSPKEFLDDLRGAAPRYSGFNLLVGGARALYYFSNRGPKRPRARRAAARFRLHPAGRRRPGAVLLFDPRADRARRARARRLRLEQSPARHS